MDNSRRVDTLSFAERFSVRTNLVDWGLTVPNIGFEYDVRSENWNRYAVNVNLRFRPRTKGTYVRPIVFNMFEGTVEGRVYWRERRAESKGYLKRHRHWIDKLFSCRNMMPSHPNWIFYRGGYATYSNYSMMFGDNGRQGTAIMAGFTWGFVKPFLAFQNGNSMDLEVGISAGLCYNKYDKYTYNDESNCYPKTGHEGWHLEKYPMVRDLHAAVVYRFGNYPIQKKYRWRYDVDEAFRNRKDSIYNAWLAERDQKYIRDSIYNVVAKEFQMLYDSCVDVRHQMEQQEIDAKSPKRLTQDSIKARKQFIRDSIAHRKDSIATAKAIKAGKMTPVTKYTKAAEKAKKAETNADKARERAKKNAAKAKAATAAQKKKTTAAKSTTAKASATTKKPEEKASDTGDSDEPELSEKEIKKAMQQEKAARAKANAEKAKARLAAQKEARKNAKGGK